MSVFDEKTVVSYARFAGLRDITFTMEAVTSDLNNRDDVHGYLYRPPHPGAKSPVETIADNDRGLSLRFATAWNDAIDRQGKITFTTPVLYLTATCGAP
jgi:hypothetical protein